MDPLVIVLIVLFVLGIGGWAAVDATRRHQLHGRQRRWQELENRFHRVTLDAERFDRSPGDALAAPGWLDRDNPVVRGFSGTLKRARRDHAELERGVAPAPGLLGRPARRAITAGNGTAAPLNPSEEDLQRLETLVDRVEDAYRDTDRAVRSVGWTRPEALIVPHPQFLLDPRWGRPAVAPRQLPLAPKADPRTGERAVKAFLDAAYPLRRDTALRLIRERTGGMGPGYRAQKSFERLLATGRYRMDTRGFLWPGDTVVDHWAVYRTFGRDAELGPEEMAPVEVANVLWFMLPEDRGLDDAELVVLARDHLGLGPGRGTALTQVLNEQISRGLLALPDGVRRVVDEVAPNGVRIPSGATRVERILADGLHEALVSGRIQRQADGTLRRLRREWPSTYRR